MIHNIDCLSFLPGKRFRTIFADVPDNIGLGYIGYNDNLPNYEEWLGRLIRLANECSDVFWLSYNQKWDFVVKRLSEEYKPKQIIWRYRFGQYNDREEASGYRPILRFSRVPLNFDAIRVPSERMRIGDKRSRGLRVPDDVWEFPRVLGKREWHPTKHPEELMERIILLSGGPICDLFLGSGTTGIVAERLGIEWCGCEISEFYCRMIHAQIKRESKL